MLRGGSQQLTDGILDSENITSGIDNLRLHVQIRCLHLVDGSTVGLTVLPKCLLGFKRLVPQTIGLYENVQLAVEHL